MPGWAHGAQSEPLVGLGIADEALVSEIESDLPLEARGDVADVTEGIAPDRVVHAGNGGLPALDAVQEIAHVMGADLELDRQGVRLELMCFSFPRRAFRASIAAVRNLRSDRCCVPNWKMRLCSWTAWRRAWSSAREQPIGFSVEMSFPALTAAIEIGTCQ